MECLGGIGGRFEQACRVNERLVSPGALDKSTGIQVHVGSGTSPSYPITAIKRSKSRSTSSRVSLSSCQLVGSI